jgi:hypothetical protein
LQAIEIKHGGVKPEDFIIPAGYTMQKNYNSPYGIPDTTFAIPDTAMEWRRIEEKPVSPNTPAPAKKSTGGTPPKSSMRKE